MTKLREGDWVRFCWTIDGKVQPSAFVGELIDLDYGPDFDDNWCSFRIKITPEIVLPFSNPEITTNLNLEYHAGETWIIWPDNTVLTVDVPKGCAEMYIMPPDRFVELLELSAKSAERSAETEVLYTVRAERSDRFNIIVGMTEQTEIVDDTIHLKEIYHENLWRLRELGHLESDDQERFFCVFGGGPMGPKFVHLYIGDQEIGKARLYCRGFDLDARQLRMDLTVYVEEEDNG